MDWCMPDSSVHGIFQVRILDFHCILQGIFPIQGSNPHLLHCRQLFTTAPLGNSCNLHIAFFFFFNLFLLVGGQLLYNIVVVFVIHWLESAMDLHIFPIPIPPPCILLSYYAVILSHLLWFWQLRTCQKLSLKRIHFWKLIRKGYHNSKY